MARQETLTGWILRNDERLDLHVQELSWIKPIFPGWHDLQVSISVFGERFIGRGSDPDANTALGKAVCEAVERATCFKHGISSLGVAGHFDFQVAAENAKLEYVERFCFGYQISKGIALEPLSSKEAIGQRYERSGVEIGFYLLASPLNTPCILCLATGSRAEPSFGGILGLGAASDIEGATQKALMECLRSLEFYLSTKPVSLGHEAFQKIQSPRSQDRQALLRDGEYFRQLMARLNIAAPADLKIPEGKIDRLTLDSFFIDCPLVFARYSTPASFTQPEFLA